MAEFPSLSLASSHKLNLIRCLNEVAEAVPLGVEALALDDQPHRARRPLRGVRDLGRQQEELPFFDHNVPVRVSGWASFSFIILSAILSDSKKINLKMTFGGLPELASLEHLEAHVALAHVEQLLSFLEVIVLPLVCLATTHVEHLSDEIVFIRNVRVMVVFALNLRPQS